MGGGLCINDTKFRCEAGKCQKHKSLKISIYFLFKKHDWKIRSHKVWSKLLIYAPTLCMLSIWRGTRARLAWLFICFWRGKKNRNCKDTKEKWAVCLTEHQATSLIRWQLWQTLRSFCLRPIMMGRDTKSMAWGSKSGEMGYILVRQWR